MQLIGPHPNFKQVRNLNVCHGTCSDVIRRIKWRDESVTKFRNFLPRTSAFSSFFFTCWSCSFFSTKEKNFILAREIATIRSSFSRDTIKSNISGDTIGQKVSELDWDFMFKSDRNDQIWLRVIFRGNFTDLRCSF